MGLFDKIKDFFTEEPKKYKSVSGSTKVVEEKNMDVERTMHIDFEAPEQQYILKLDGEYFVYNSVDEMPEDVRKGVEALEMADKISSSYTVIVDGKRETYASLEDMPEDVREALDKDKGKDKKE